MIVAVIDIGTGSAGGAFVELKENSLPKILFNSRADIEFQEPADFPSLVARASEALKKLSDIMHKSGVGHPAKVYCNLFSPFYTYQTKLSKYAEPKGESFLVTKKIIDRLAEKEAEAIVKNGRLLEQKIMKVKLNGYETAAPFGKRAKEAEVSSYISVAPEPAMPKIFETLRSAFNQKNIEFHSFAFLLFSAFRDILSKESDYIFADVGGETTDVSIVRDGVIRETISFPIGQRFMLRSVVKELGTVPEEASSSIALYKDGSLEENMRNRVGKIVDNAAREWLASFSAATESIGKSLILPSEVFVIGDARITPMYARNIGQPFRVSFIDAPVLSPFVAIGPKARADDLFLIIETIFADKIFKLKNKN
jgi:hypothetical protein